MVTLGKLVTELSGAVLPEKNFPADQPVLSLSADSRRVGPGTLFVALRGERADGHDFAAEALGKGCCAVVVERERAGLDRARVIRVTDSHQAYGRLAAAWYGFPARGMTMIGITGTNGKTTTSWIIEEMLRTAGEHPGVIGTVNYRFTGAKGEPVVCAAPLTTPEPCMLHALLRQMHEARVTHVVMEVSSHALMQQRLAGIEFDMALFTNLSRDHLDYHGTMTEYFSAKQRLFLENMAPGGIAVVVDDNRDRVGREESGWGEKLIDILQTRGFVRHGGKRSKGEKAYITCGLHRGCTVQASAIGQTIDSCSATLHLGSRKIPVRTGLIGRHNVLNMLTAAGVGLGLGLAPQVISRGLGAVGQVPGRLERVALPPYTQKRKKAAVFVDYAHTPDALENVLQTLRPLTRGRLLCIFGCGGDRDRGKRPLMGRAASEYADLAVVTSDNPRSEDPRAIIGEIEAGLRESGSRRVELERLLEGQGEDKRYAAVEDRARAIHAICAMAEENDVVLIAGKGHENYQITADGKRFFDDRIQAADSRLRWTDEKLVRATAGNLEQPGRGLLLGEISTDTRTIRAGDVFLALKGENFNGHEFVGTAVQRGAAALIVSESSPGVAPGISVIRVADTLRALGDLAAYRRQALAPELRVIGITGSSGKTTVKEMTAAIFQEHYARATSGQVLKTEGNLNNLVGLPLSLLQVSAGHRTAVLEMGMNRPGEIQRLAGIADPGIGCITNVQAAHLEGLGSIEGVARAKLELFEAMGPKGIRVINYDDPNIRKVRGRYGDNVIGFGATPSGRRVHPAIRATRISSLGESGMRFTLHIREWCRRITIPAPGEHNVANATAAAAIATAAGVNPEAIIRGLSSYRSGDKRLQMLELPGGVKVLNDAYNANPSSMAAALRTVTGFGGKSRKAAILGDMLELGSDSDRAHRQIGSMVGEMGFDFLAVKGDFGPLVAEAAAKSGMRKKGIMVARDPGAIAAWVMGLISSRELRSGDWILLKGSRGMRMEQVLAELATLMNIDRG